MASQQEDQPDQDIVLAHEDIEQVIDDDGQEDRDWEDEEETAAGAAGDEPLITDDPSEPKERPDNAIAGTCKWGEDSSNRSQSCIPPDQLSSH